MVMARRLWGCMFTLMLFGLLCALITVHMLAGPRPLDSLKLTARSVYSSLAALRYHNEIEAELAARNSVRFVLFTSWTDKPYKRLIHDNVLRTWPLTSPHTACLLFSEQKYELRRVETFGWYGLPLPNTSCEGVPILREMFFAAMRAFPKAQLFAFANGDLLFGSDLGVTVQHILRQPMVNTSPLLLLAHRDNLNFTGRHEVSLTDVEVVAELKAKASKLIDASSDIFMTNRAFPWQHAPDIVVGRLAIGMGLVSMSQALGVTIIDLSGTVTALHMTSAAGDKESTLVPTYQCNNEMFDRMKLARKRFKFCPYLGCSSYMTVGAGPGNKVTSVELVPISDYHKADLCSRCRFDRKVLMKLNYTG